MIDKLVKVAGKLRGCSVCEVGPGPGSLTRSILNAGVKKLVAVERDSRFLPSLEVSPVTLPCFLEAMHLS